MHNEREKRRIKLIKPSFQLKLVGIFVGITAVSLLIQLALLNFDLRATAQRMNDPSVLITSIPHILGRAALFSAGMVIPLTVGIGIVVTHRIAGPIYRFEQHLSAVARREATEPCRLRDGDEFQDLCLRLNEAIEALSGLATREADGALDEVERRFRQAG